MNVIRLDLWHVSKRGLREVEHIKIKSGYSIAQMKVELAKALKPLLRSTEYYYVVAVVRKDDGSKGYRTIVSKTVVA